MRYSLISVILAGGFVVMQKVLLVEDDERLSRLIGYMLLQNGFTVEYAKDTESARSMSFNDNYSAIVIDHITLGLDFDIAPSNIKSVTGKTPVLLMISRSQEGNPYYDPADGVAEIIYKPFQLSDIVKSVKRISGDINA